MRHKLARKFFLGYLIFGVLAFLIVASLSTALTHQFLIERQSKELYDEANHLARYYLRFTPDLSHAHLSDPANRAHFISEHYSCDVWIIDRSGNILLDSCGFHLNDEITEFDPLHRGNDLYTIHDCYGAFEDDVLSVLAPISGNFTTYGYVYLHLPMQELISAQNAILNIVYITELAIFFCSALFLLMFHILVSNPLDAITIGAKEYAAGNLKHKIHVDTEDEMGYLANTLNYMSSELSDMEETQRKFISNISHDFRSPLTSIKGYLEAMIDGTIPPELYDKYMKLVISETERLTKLTSSTLALKSLEQGGNLLDLEDFDINAVIKQTAATFEGPCKRRHLILDLTFSDDVLYVQADMSKIQQVLYNLIDNAIKFSPENAVIWIESYSRGEKVFVSVKDNGTGIPRDSMKKIWSRFYKADNSRGKDKKGTGLGLAICKEIINAHNQIIDVISTEGVGSEFIFSLKKSNLKQEEDTFF